MKEQVIKHEVVLPKSVIMLLVLIAVGLCGNLFSAFFVQDAVAQMINPWSENIYNAIDRISYALNGMSACRN